MLVGSLLAMIVVLAATVVVLLTTGQSDVTPAADGAGQIPVGTRGEMASSALDLTGEPAGEWTFDPDSVVPGGIMHSIQWTGDSFPPPELMSFGDVVVGTISADDDANGAMVGLDTASGSVVWTVDTGSAEPYCATTEDSSLVCGSVEVAGDGSGPLVRLDPLTGEVLGRTDELFTHPQVEEGSDGRVLVLDNGGGGLAAVAVDANSLSTLWRTDLDLAGEEGGIDPGRIAESGAAVAVGRSNLSWVLDPTTGKLISSPPAAATFDDGYLVSSDGTTTTVTDANGYAILAAAGEPWYDGRQGLIDDGKIGVGPTLYDLTTGDEIWTSADLGPESYPSFLDDRRFVLADSASARETLIDASDGRRTVVLDNASALPRSWWVGDDVGATVDLSGTLQVFGSDDGERLWSRDLGEVVYDERTSSTAVTATVPTSAGLAVVGANGVRGFTGFAQRGSPDEPAPDSDGTDYVTDCGTPPELTAVQAVAADGGVRVTFEATATCPGGQWLAYSDQHVGLEVDGETFASGSFDFATSPRWVSEDGSTIDLVFPPGSVFATPEEINEAIERDGGSGDVVHVPCEKGPDSAPGPVPADPADASDDPVSAEGSADTDEEDSDSALAALRRIAAADAPYLDSEIAGSWVPQLSSKKPGTSDDGIVYDYDDILAEHLRLRLRYPDVRLAFSTEWGSYLEDEYWVTLVATPSATDPPALAFCSAQLFDRGHCYAKLLRRDGPAEGTTVLQPES